MVVGAYSGRRQSAGDLCPPVLLVRPVLDHRGRGPRGGWGEAHLQLQLFRQGGPGRLLLSPAPPSPPAASPWPAPGSWMTSGITWRDRPSARWAALARNRTTVVLQDQSFVEDGGRAGPVCHLQSDPAPRAVRGGGAAGLRHLLADGQRPPDGVRHHAGAGRLPGAGVLLLLPGAGEPWPCWAASWAAWCSPRWGRAGPDGWPRRASWCATSSAAPWRCWPWGGPSS